MDQVSVGSSFVRQCECLSIKEEVCSPDDDSTVAKTSVPIENTPGVVSCFCLINCSPQQCGGDVHTGLFSCKISTENNIKLEYDGTFEGDVNLNSPETVMSGDVSNTLISSSADFNSKCVVNPKIVKTKQCHVPLGERRRVVSKHFGRILQCPKCAVCFKFGFQGKGPRLLIDHVSKHHKKFKKDCMLAIMRRYKAEYDATRN